jgi:hypothetical protein
MCLQKLDQEWHELRDHVINGIRHDAERFEQRISLDNRRFSERHVKGEMNLLLRFNVSLPDQDYLVLFQAANLQARHRIEPNSFRTEFRNLRNFAENLVNYPPRDIDTPFSQTESESDQQSMLVDNVEPVQTPESVPIPFSALVWLDKPHGLYHVLSKNSFYLSTKLGFVLIKTLRDREENAAFIETLRGGNLSQGVGQVVESTPEIVDGIACDQGKYRQEWSGDQALGRWFVPYLPN